jgi:hypothetical protein
MADGEKIQQVIKSKDLQLLSQHITTLGTYTMNIFDGII